MFYLMLDHPDLINIFKEKQTNETIKILEATDQDERKRLLDFFNKSVLTETDFKNIKQSLDNYKENELYNEFKFSCKKPDEIKNDFIEIYERAYKSDLESQKEYLLSTK
ncbi:UNVERIFIED_CONTAM: hypothetical protein O8I53_11310 [Campylobacter lari]